MSRSALKGKGILKAHARVYTVPQMADSTASFDASANYQQLQMGDRKYSNVMLPLLISTFRYVT
jgi:hypothetical protein